MYSEAGFLTAMLGSLVSVGCHVLANINTKKGNYEQFVIWHSLWHATGVGLIIVCLTLDGYMGTCWEGSGWETWFVSLDSVFKAVRA